MTSETKGPLTRITSFLKILKKKLQRKKRETVNEIYPLMYAIFSIRFKFQFCSLLSIEKACFIFNFWSFFYSARKSGSPPWKNTFPHETFLLKKILQRTPPPSKNRPNWKVYIHFPIANTICKQWAKCIACFFSPKECGGSSHLQWHSYHIFRICWTKWPSQILYRVSLGNKVLGRGLAAL